MKYLRLFENREEEIHRICRKWASIKNYTINPDGSIDVNGHVNLNGSELTELPLQFRRVSSFFSCSYNKLTTLKGAPKYVGGSFYCHNNNITDLEHFPEYVVSGIYPSDNPIWTMVRYFTGKEDRHKIIELFNFSGVIQEGSRVILMRLEYVFDAYGIRITNGMLREIGKYYTIIKR